MSDCDLVLVVDDDIAVRDALVMLLESCGWTARGYASARELLAQGMPRERRCCLVVDQSMPQMTGLELVTVLRSRGCRTPVILVTGLVDGRMRIRRAAADLGVADTLDKPIDTDELERAIAAALAASV